MIRFPLLSLPVALLGAHAWAAPGDDPRILTIDYSQGGLFHLATSPETNQTVLFAPGERIQSVVVSDPGAYQISVAGSGDSLSLKPTGMSALAVVSVRTELRSYQLELVPGRSGVSVPSVIRFRYGEPTRATVMAPVRRDQVPGWSWALKGDKALRPATIRDDGSRTYIEWPRDAALPAVFAIGPAGKEEMVEGYVRGGLVTIDRVYTELIFRIDHAKAEARRTQTKALK